MLTLTTHHPNIKTSIDYHDTFGNYTFGTELLCINAVLLSESSRKRGENNINYLNKSENENFLTNGEQVSVIKLVFFIKDCSKLGLRK